MENTQIQWHPAFVAALNLELSENRDSLSFHREHNLNVRPLEIDLLITKKFSGSLVDNEIGRLFRGHNILEYKDPQDHLNIDVFFKVEGYACLYKSYGKTVNAIKEEDITLTLIRDARPAGLFRYFEKHGYQLSNPYSGIYYIVGKMPFLAQIIVTKELDPKLHVWLRALSGKLEKQDMQNLLSRTKRLHKKMDREYAEAVLEVAFRANMKIMAEFMGDDHMSEEFLELVKPIIAPKIYKLEQEALNRGIEQGIERGIEQGIEQGIERGIEQGIRGSIDMLRDIGCMDENIKVMIMKKYSLSAEKADQYLFYSNDEE